MPPPYEKKHPLHEKLCPFCGAKRVGLLEATFGGKCGTCGNLVYGCVAVSVFSFRNMIVERTCRRLSVKAVAAGLVFNYDCVPSEAFCELFEYQGGALTKFVNKGCEGDGPRITVRRYTFWSTEFLRFFFAFERNPRTLKSGYGCALVTGYGEVVKLIAPFTVTLTTKGRTSDDVTSKLKVEVSLAAMNSEGVIRFQTSRQEFDEGGREKAEADIRKWPDFLKLKGLPVSEKLLAANSRAIREADISRWLAALEAAAEKRREAEAEEAIWKAELVARCKRGRGGGGDGQAVVVQTARAAGAGGAAAGAGQP